MMLRKTKVLDKQAVRVGKASMRPQHDAAENLRLALMVSSRLESFNEAAA